jgi:hypothetical protein
VTALPNGLTRHPSRLLILDDYHLVTAQGVHDDLGYLIEYAPPGFCLVIAARADPPLRLGRLRARGELTDLRAADLRAAGTRGGVVPFPGVVDCSWRVRLKAGPTPGVCQARRPGNRNRAGDAGAGAPLAAASGYFWLPGWSCPMCCTAASAARSICSSC